MDLRARESPLFRLHGELGSLEVGKWADLAIPRSPHLIDLIRVGLPAIRSVIKKGRLLVDRSRPQPRAH